MLLEAAHFDTKVFHRRDEPEALKEYLSCGHDNLWSESGGGDFGMMSSTKQLNVEYLETQSYISSIIPVCCINKAPPVEGLTRQL